MRHFPALWLCLSVRVLLCLQVELLLIRDSKSSIGVNGCLCGPVQTWYKHPLSQIWSYVVRSHHVSFTPGIKTCPESVPWDLISLPGAEWMNLLQLSRHPLVCDLTASPTDFLLCSSVSSRLQWEALHDEELTLSAVQPQEDTRLLHHPQSTHGGIRGERSTLFGFLLFLSFHFPTR